VSGSFDGRAEWLEADGLGGFASGTVSGIRSRRYHALLLAATNPPTGRMVLVNGFDAWIEAGETRVSLSAQRYAPDVVDGDGVRHIEAFTDEPWPRWSFRLEDGGLVEHELFVPKGAALVALAWRVSGAAAPATLAVRPFLSGRDYHSLHHENPSFRFDALSDGGRLLFRPYDGVPAVAAVTNGTYAPEAHWYRGFLYEDERARGLDHVEDLAAPGVFRFDLTKGEAVLILAADGLAQTPALPAGDWIEELRGAERRRRAAFPTRLHRSADAYLVRRGQGRTIVAGYPWFTDWGRDTFIAIRGLCLAASRLDEAGDILLEWSHAVSQGLLPNRFPDRPDDVPEFNSVDASLWYVIAVHEYLEAVRASGGAAIACRACGTPSGHACLERAVLAILDGYSAGTRHGIHMDGDGLLAAGEHGQQLTWMDARVDGREITPRIGKPVEIQALWLNAVRIGAGFAEKWEGAFERGRAAFERRFWNESAGCLYDVVDVDHRAGTADATFRPNQVLAVGGLPHPLLEGPRARQVVDALEARLLTPLGLRSLAREEPGYAARYDGGVADRDGVYHQGTVWPWLIGPFVEAWVRVRGATTEVRTQARERFLTPLLRHMEEAGLGHVSEIADADAPHTPRGSPFQAWSVGEALRLDQVVLAPPGPARARRRSPARPRRQAAAAPATTAAGAGAHPHRPLPAGESGEMGRRLDERRGRRRRSRAEDYL
jgi:predicted glycogen debranching enzyme